MLQVALLRSVMMVVVGSSPETLEEEGENVSASVSTVPIMVDQNRCLAAHETCCARRHRDLLFGRPTWSQDACLCHAHGGAGVPDGADDQVESQWTEKREVSRGEMGPLARGWH